MSSEQKHSAQKDDERAAGGVEEATGMVKVR
jgi:hypothetical protein